MLDDAKILWGLNSVLLGVALFFIKMWIARLREDIKELKEELREKANQGTCDRIHAGVDRLLHSHASVGAAGEVVHGR